MKKLGINGFGRIGKLTVWNQVGNKYFDELIVNLGRDVGSSFSDIVHYVERDSTYGSLSSFLYGFKKESVIEKIDEADGSIIIDGVKVKFLRSDRDPKNIKWKENGVELVVDTTGQFLDPTVDNSNNPFFKSHLIGGAKKVIASAPFKIKDSSKGMPEDAITTVMGINGDDYDPSKHNLISNASCTTTCLAHMIKPLLDEYGSENIMSCSMTTIHAATGSQNVLDSLAKKGKTDLRKNRSILNNIILTTTGAAKALSLVIPEMKKIGFSAESVRVPTTSGSLIILVVNIKGGEITKESLNNIYKETAENDKFGYLKFSEKQNVSSDIIGVPRAAAIIEGNETDCNSSKINDISVNQAVIYGWYDNEFGSYVNMLSDRIIDIANKM